MFFLIYGEDRFRSREALSASQAKFRKDRDASGLNTVRLTANDGLNRAEEELFASPFLAEKKLLILEDFCGLPKKDQERLAETIGRKPETTVVIFFEEGGADKLAKSPLFGMLARQKYSREYPALSPLEASRFAVAAASENGVRFEAAALRRLMEAVGTDSWRIRQETAKLAAQALSQKRETIEAKDVEETVSGSREESVFAYIDACTDGHGQRAMAALEALLTAGEAEVQIVSLLQRHFRLMAMARDLMSRGLRRRSPIQTGGSPLRRQKSLERRPPLRLPLPRTDHPSPGPNGAGPEVRRNPPPGQPGPLHRRPVRRSLRPQETPSLTAGVFYIN